MRRAYDEGQAAAHEQARREVRGAAGAVLANALQPPAPALTPEQFAFWVKGIADCMGGNSQLVSPYVVDRILQAARNLKP